MYVRHVTSGGKRMKSTSQMLGHTPAHSLARSHRSLIQWHLTVRQKRPPLSWSFSTHFSLIVLDKGHWCKKIWLRISSKFLTDKVAIKQWDSPYVNGLPRLKWLNESSKIYHRNITLNVRNKGLIGAYSKRAIVELAKIGIIKTIFFQFRIH